MVPWFGPSCFHGAHGTYAPFIILAMNQSGSVDVDRAALYDWIKRLRVLLFRRKPLIPLKAFIAGFAAKPLSQL
jgi:hypothetical protein